MIRDFDDFCRELNTCGFSMDGGNAKGIFALVEYAHATGKPVRYLEG